MARGWPRGRTIGHGAIVAALAAVSVGLNTRFDAPPRFDGAGYAVLARSVLASEGYREIDHPDAPRHAHFPPGYPLVLAALWRLTGPSATAAHALSAACTVAATVAAWAWFRRLYPPRVALLLGMALAINWTWGRVGGSIQSEPFYLLLEAVARLATVGAAQRGGIRRGLVLGAVLGACVLTRHVAACMALAVLLELILRRRRAAATAAALVAAVLVAPWVGWLATVRLHTQLGLLPRSGLAGVIAGNALFYLRRLPDQVAGPLVEVGTVFRPSWRGPATAGAALASAVVLLGWARALGIPRRRLAALVPLATFPLLLVWPFTEAGRFLIPLVPFVLVGAVEGLSAVGAWAGWRRLRTRAAWAVLVASIPYAAYAIATDRAGAAERSHAAFDAACDWIARHGEIPGPVLTRHPGEVYWQTGRHALEPPGGEPEAIEQEIQKYGIVYLLLDPEPYARAPASPLGRFVAARPGRVRRAWGEGGAVAVFAVGR
jgi:hypothetical protein